jgi:hypothetical protein
MDTAQPFTANLDNDSSKRGANRLKIHLGGGDPLVVET